MKFLVLYSSIEGQTRKIAEAIASHLEALRHTVMLSETNQLGFADPGVGDGIILCAPVHSAHYPSPFIHYVRGWAPVLNDMPSAFISVSLSIASSDIAEQEEARNYGTALSSETGWIPKAVLNCAGALKYSEYDYFKKWMLKRISATEDGPIDARRDYELTNWSAVKTFVNEFIQSIAIGTFAKTDHSQQQ
ncbi:flavodoxin domain-containing protein [Phyllobacterium sp. P30BS-XVII]|uniref:flavodoxin domain-containing protein n=1 Tax=Phyllobacterium sp. P30BS-XVII TaxID=2587046 RepID=UPI0013AF438B|nr:flavodoxin domain-containing protein [Phyllobacterium sp. P30BS-XVII]MBA8903141.1 menaquinone-dependent protoporphyrinogen oxidase [Phyllobacterium sp. P30BS-XVII]